MFKKLCASILCVGAVHAANNLVDLVCFSFDRGIQMDAHLESVKRRVNGLNEIHVLYRASETKYDEPYQDLQKRFSTVHWVKQGAKPAQDFKPLLLSILHNSKADYVLFSVDDIIVTEDVDLSVCVDALKTTGAYAFYLRLGKNITYCYAENKRTPVPPLKSLGNDVWQWRIADGKGDWGYPNSVDLTVFRKDQVLRSISDLNFTNPNYFESSWSHHVSRDWCGLCFGMSKMINIPINVVQNTFSNRNMHLYSKEDLLKLYLDGFTFDVEKLYKIPHNSAHFEVRPTLIKRN